MTVSVVHTVTTTCSLSTWLLKTRMSFYQDEGLELPWWFGLCCWNFAIAGMVLLWTTHNKKSQSCYQYPYRTVAWILILVQSPLSFLADYVYMTQDSYWHVVDRCFALPLMSLELVKFVIMCRESFCFLNATTTATNATSSSTKPMRPLACVAYGMAMVLAIYCFGQSTASQANLDRQGFILWHTAWHFYPLLASTIVLWDYSSLYYDSFVDYSLSLESSSGPNHDKRPRIIKTASTSSLSSTSSTTTATNITEEISCFNDYAIECDFEDDDSFNNILGGTSSNIPRRKNN